jgi:hypothetical protein
MARLFCFRLLELHTARRSTATLHALLPTLLLALLARISSILLPSP